MVPYMHSWRNLGSREGSVEPRKHNKDNMHNYYMTNIVTMYIIFADVVANMM